MKVFLPWILFGALAFYHSLYVAENSFKLRDAAFPRQMEKGKGCEQVKDRINSYITVNGTFCINSEFFSVSLLKKSLKEVPKKADGLSFEEKQKGSGHDEYPEDFLDGENELGDDLKEVVSFEVKEEIEEYDDTEDDPNDNDPDVDDEYDYEGENGDSDLDGDIDEDYNIEGELENNITSNTSVQWLHDDSSVFFRNRITYLDTVE